MTSAIPRSEFMNMMLRLAALVLLSSLLYSPALAQKNEIRIIRTASGDQAVPGQLVLLFIDGISIRKTPIASIEKFQVLVTQNGQTQPALVRMATEVILPKQEAQPSAVVSPSPDTREMPATESLQTAVTFTLPGGLHEGEAGIVLTYRGQRSSMYMLNVASRLPVPEFIVPVVTVPLSNSKLQGSTAEEKEKTTPVPKLERGHETTVIINPLFDPEVVDVAVLVAFRQGGVRREVVADIVSHKPVENGSGMLIFDSMRYEVRLRTPLDLAIGPAEVEVRLRVNGQVGESGKASIQITDSLVAGAPSAARPHILLVDPDRIGIGQAIYLLVDDPRRLQPEPEKVLIVLEQGERRIELQPEIFGVHDDSGPLLGPMLLRVRLGQEVTGKATLRVLHPLRGEAGSSEEMPIEITAEVLPPEVRKVAEANRQDIAQMKAVQEKLAEAGKAVAKYDSKFHYVTIDARGMDHDPKHLRIVFRQGDKSYALRDQDYAFVMGDHFIVRLPDGIKAGEATVTLQNIGAGQVSMPAIEAFEVAQPGKQ